jgi:hypothetical protein
MIVHSSRASRCDRALAAMLLVGTALGAVSPAGAAQPASPASAVPGK